MFLCWRVLMLPFHLLSSSLALATASASLEVLLQQLWLFVSAVPQSLPVDQDVVELFVSAFLSAVCGLDHDRQLQRSKNRHVISTSSVADLGHRPSLKNEKCVAAATGSG